MTRPLRLEYPGAYYHITSRGNRREDVFVDTDDRSDFLHLLGDVCHRFHWKVYAYCLMMNHYHLLLVTPEGNLSKGMRHLNGVYTQHFNRRHQRVGHVFQGRYKAIVVEKDHYLMELLRYVTLNPVRAGMVEAVGEWPWSSFNAMVSEHRAADWLDRDQLLALFGSNRELAVLAYVEFINEGIGKPSPWGKLSHQILLGDDAFISRFSGMKSQECFDEIPKAERQLFVKSLSQYRLDYSRRDEAMARAYLSGAYTMKQIASFFSVHYMTVSRAVKKFQKLECET